MRSRPGPPSRRRPAASSPTSRRATPSRSPPPRCRRSPSGALASALAGLHRPHGRAGLAAAVALRPRAPARRHRDPPSAPSAAERRAATPRPISPSRRPPSRRRPHPGGSRRTARTSAPSVRASTPRRPLARLRILHRPATSGDYARAPPKPRPLPAPRRRHVGTPAARDADRRPPRAARTADARHIGVRRKADERPTPSARIAHDRPTQYAPHEDVAEARKGETTCPKPS